MIVHFYFLHGVCSHYVIHFIKNSHCVIHNVYVSRKFPLMKFCLSVLTGPSLCTSVFDNSKCKQTWNWIWSGNVCRCLSCRSHAAGVVRCYGHRWRHSSLCVTGSRWSAEGSSPLRTLHVERNRATCSPTDSNRPSQPTYCPPKPPSCLHTAPCYDAGLEKKLRSKCMIVSLIDKEWVSVTTAHR